MKKTCPICGKEYEDKTKRHNKKACCPEHRSKLYYNKHKEKIKQQVREEYYAKKGFPSFQCPNCGAIMKLNFEPKTNFLKWKNLICPNCGAKRTKSG